LLQLHLLLNSSIGCCHCSSLYSRALWLFYKLQFFLAAMQSFEVSKLPAVCTIALQPDKTLDGGLTTVATVRPVSSVA
jgi:hypothetical protein